jgi:tRNA A37 methylthiotransferase MiaB
VFPYSPRPGTRTADADPVPAAVKRRRSERLRALSDRLGHARRASRVGQRDVVLVERVDTGGCLHGYGADYTAYELRAHAGVGVGDLVEVVLEAPGERAALGGVL